jgi:predicted NACHT family NTPase
MAGQTGRSLRLSAQGIEKANTALLKFGSKADLAAQLQMSRTTINKFFKGEPVEQKKFRAICKKLKLILEEVADLPEVVESEPIEQNQDNSSDIDELVRQVRSRCCDKVQHLYSKIQLLNCQQIDVDKLYVDVYVLDKLASESYATIPDLLQGSDLRDGFDRLGLGKREKRSPGFEVAAQYPRLMILGKPGAGKTTFLRHLAIACCKDEFLADHIPILIELRDINASEFNLLNHIHQEFDLADEEQTKQILKQGKVLILLDGLDEVPGQSRREVQDHIYKFSQFQHYYKNRFILTCRTQTIEYISDKFKPVEVADFNPEQVEFFALNWFTALAETPEQGATLKAHFMAKLRLPQNKPTAELAVTPILLSLTCWVFDYLKDLPPKRSDLYEQGINLLLEKWDKKRGVRRELGSEAYRKLSVGEKKKLLSYVAARKFEQEQYVLFEQGEIQEYIAKYRGISTEDSEAVLDAIAAQNGLLIERAHGFWSFSHLTFQEYFTAKWFCDRADWDGLVSHITEKHWREVFLLAGGMMRTVDKLLQLMKKVIDRHIASDEELQQFLNWGNRKSCSVQVPYKLAAVRAFYLNLPSATVLDLGSSPDFELECNLMNSLEPTLGSRFSPYASSFYEHALDLDFRLMFGLGLFLEGTRIPEYVLDICISSLAHNRDYRFSLVTEMEQSLQSLRNQLPDFNTERLGFWEWRETEGQAWARKLRDVLIKYRNIGHDWQFSTPQKELLQQYYDTNKLLADCLNSACSVSEEVKAEIEETLLLPVTEIEKRQQQVQVKDVADE